MLKIFSALLSFCDAFRVIDMQINQMVYLVLDIGKSGKHFRAQSCHVTFVNQNTDERGETGKKSSQEKWPILVCVHG
jgi:hypothetical protein